MRDETGVEMRVARGFDVLKEAVASEQPGPAAPSRQRVRQAALDLARQETLIDAAYCFCIVPLERRPDAADLLLHAGGEALPASWLIPESGELTALACAVCTIGPRLERRVSALFAERRASLALALDQLGNELLFAVSRRTQDRMQADLSRRGLCMAGELRAGDPGLVLDAQAAVLRLAQAENIGVELPHGSIMTPLKSTSMVLGVGIDLPVVSWSRCDQCPNRGKCAAVSRAKPAAPARAGAGVPAN
jgi:acyl transferase domain-containing protein